MLQTFVRAPTTNPTRCSEDIHTHKIRVDFESAQMALQWLDAHFTLPTYDIEAQLDPVACWLPQCLDWIRQDWYDWEGPVECIRVYYDGSFESKTDNSGSATAAFVLQDGTWKFAGALSVQQHKPKFESYTAELTASLIACKQVFDLVKINAEVFSTSPAVEFMYDSLSVGKQSEGQWQARQDPTTCHAIRSLVRVIEKRWKVSCQHFHVTGHSGDPGNELVDTLARCAAQGKPLQNWNAFLEQITQKNFVQSLEWVWALFTSHLGSAWQSNQLELPTNSTTNPDSTKVLPFGEATSTDGHGNVKLHLLTCNVLTLLPGPHQMEAWGAGGPTRLQIMLRQLKQAEISVFAFQETRLRTDLKLRHEDFILFHAPANDRGHFGIMVGIAKTQAFAFHDNGKPHDQGWLEESQIAVIAAEPRLLILRVCNEFLKVIIVAAHAPHTGAAIEDIEDYWQRIDRHIGSKYSSWPKLLLADANSRVGDSPNNHIGPHDAERSCPKSDAFSHFVAQQHLFLPATFADIHEGPSGTWKHPNGTWTRNDFIGVPFEWPLTQCLSWTDIEMDFSLTKDDHRPARALLRWPAATKSQNLQAQRIKACPAQLCPNAIKSLLADPINQSAIDVHTHFGILQDSLASCTRSTEPLHFRKPQKPHMTSTTWELVCAKKKWRSNLARCQRLQTRTTMHLLFAAWRHGIRGICFKQEAHSFDAILSQLDRDVAIALHNFRTLGIQVTQATRRDDIVFYQNLAQESSRWLGPSETRQFWKVLRRSLPRFRQRRRGFDPLSIEPLEDQWMPHFTQLEVGEQMHPAELLHECHERQRQTAPAQTHFDIAELPSLMQLEDVLRQTKPHKATGHDSLPSVLFRNHACDLAEAFFPLLLKMMVWQQEPFAGKGGPLAVIHKKGNHLVASNYRGIMLLPTFTKRVHALLRTQLMQLLERQRPPGQLGGFSHQQVMYGSQSLQVFGRIMDTLKLTSAVLFLDLATAFHRLVREWVSGVHVPADLLIVFQALEQEGLDVAEMCERIHMPSLLETLRAPPFLIQLMKDIHASTWMTIGSRRFANTKRGTRPGSPLADCVFHILMADILHQLDDWIQRQEDFQRILAEYDIPGGFVAWAYDLAIPWATTRAADMPKELRRILQFVLQLFEKYGFLLNLEKGKTSAVVTFRGSGAPQMRQMYQLNAKPGDSFTLEGREKQIFLHYVPSYKHLGTTFAANHNLEVEIQQRIGLAQAAFGQIAKPILCNRHLPESTRIQLFHSLIGTKLFFGLGAWQTPTYRQCAKLRAFLLRLLRKVLRLKPDQVASIPAAEILQRARQSEPRVRHAVDRLLYAQRLWEHGPAELQHMLHREHALCPNSWMHGLLADLEWLQKLEPHLPYKPPVNTEDLTDLFDYWQGGHREWQKRIKAALQRHLRQEGMMHQMHRMHTQLFQIFKDQATFLNDTFVDDVTKHEYVCFCNRTFTTPQGLASHKRLAHNIGAREKHLIDGATCPCCLKFLWTRQRLYQHLAYIPRKGQVNHCFQSLQRSGFQVTDECSTVVSDKLAGLHRTEALQAMGPIPLFKDSRERDLRSTLAKLAQCENQLHIEQVPDDPEQHQNLFWERLTAQTQLWFQRFQDGGFDADTIKELPDAWLDQSADQDPRFGIWLESVYISWREKVMPDILAELIDGEAEMLIEQAFTDMIYEFPRMQLLTEITFLRQKIRRLETEQHVLFPHRTVKRGSANAKERISSALHIPAIFNEQDSWLQKIRKIKFDNIPEEKVIPATVDAITVRPVFLVVHLFSGRRRSTDIHACLETFASQMGFRVQILSLDTAVSVHFGNLQYGRSTWKHLANLYRSGRVSATICGAPCETFSAARHHKPEGISEADAQKWPRPLRSTERFLGLPGLTFRELRQVAQGSEFFFQGIFAAAWSLRFGSLYLSEHPWMPEDEQKVSIWTSPWVKLLLQLPQVKLHRVCQWRWGASASKPTGILAINCPSFLSSIYKRQIPNAEKPLKVAIGRDEVTGEFRTAVLKEYPAAFSNALAGVLADQFALAARRVSFSISDMATPESEAWLQDALASCKDIRATAHWMPDFQG